MMRQGPWLEIGGLKRDKNRILGDVGGLAEDV